MGSWFNDIEDALKDSPLVAKYREENEIPEDEELEWWDFIYDVFDGKDGIDAYEVCGELAVGLSYSSMKENETLGDFRERSRQALKDIGISCNPDWVEGETEN
jgi:hypothetical protein